jgi:hypothetical protein
MNDSGSLMPFGSSVPSTSQGKSVASRQPGQQRAAAPVYEGEELGFHSGMLRGEGRDALSAAVRARLNELAGSVIEWWVEINDQNRPEAAFFGDRGLALAMPGTGTGNKPVTELSCYVLNPASLRSRTVRERSASSWLKRPRVARKAGTGTELAQQSQVATNLSAKAKGILGNLPAEAQQLLQAPFTPKHEVLGCDWHYEGTDTEITMFMFYLAGAKEVTVACGSSEIPPGGRTASWSLQIHRAQVVKRIGRDTWIRG